MTAAVRDPPEGLDLAEVLTALDPDQRGLVLCHILGYAPSVLADGIAYAMAFDAELARRRAEDAA